MDYVLWMLLLMMKFIFLLFSIFMAPNPIKFTGILISMLLLSLQFSKSFMGFSTHFFENYDMLSIGLIILTLWVIIMMVFYQNHIAYKNMMHIMILSLMFSLLLTFTTTNLFMFYFFFEWSLIPIFLIIMGWGYQPERMKASLSLFFYTLFASLPLLMAILMIANWSMLSKFGCYYNIMNSSFLSLITVFAFLVKFPMYAVHLWLPKAHVEAPVAGSMILAGVLLKLGGYGIIRISSMYNINWLMMQLVSISLLGGGLLSILCLSQSDMKVVIAYSSVVHMALVIAGVLFLSNWGLEGSLIIMIAHGVCSSGMFAAANMMYERSHSRSFYFNSGLLNSIPSFSMMWFILIVANFGGPFTYNLLGEIMLIISLTTINNFMLLVLCLLSFFSAAYSIIIYSSTNQGQMKLFMFKTSSFKMYEMLILYSHLWPLLFLCFFLSSFFF